MPDLPTLTVSTTQANRLLGVFGGQTDDDGNDLTAQQAYRRWLVRTLREHVLRVEAQTISEADNANKRDQLAAIEADLPDEG